MGFEPVNPLGQCFDSVAQTALEWVRSGDTDFSVCHGVGIANMPGQEGEKIAHAWLEKDHVAYDCTWGVKQHVDTYRQALKVIYWTAYPWPVFFSQWKRHDFPGPWSERIIEALNPEDAAETRQRIKTTPA